jgi:vanillate O-demethylase ferredoxin subunit
LRTAATIVRFADREGIYLDACSGQVLGQRTPWGGFFGFMEQVHKLRFITENGDVTELVGGTIAILFASMVVGGVILAWPGTLRALKATLRPTLKPGTRAFDLMLHRSLGSYVFVVLLVSMLGSLTFTFGWARATINAVTRSGSPLPKPRPRAAAGSLPLEDFLRRARGLMPSMGLAILTPPRKPTEALESTRSTATRPTPTPAATRTSMRRAASCCASSPTRRRAGEQGLRWMGALHTARAGIALQLVLFLGILAVPVMAFTGIRSYLGRRRTPSRNQTS